jgi:hypothetical protein
MLGKKPEELLHHQGKEITPIMRKLNAFTKKVQEDIEKEKITEADGQKLIVRATITVSMLTTK